MSAASSTRRAAYELALENAETVRAQIVEFLRSYPAGLTADEIADALGKSPFTIRPRVTELKKAGKLRETGVTRPNITGRYRSGRKAAVVALVTGQLGLGL